RGSGSLCHRGILGGGHNARRGGADSARRPRPQHLPATKSPTDMNATPPAADLRATIAQLWIYPVKSCAGIQLTEAELTETGLLYDRAWMVVDSAGEFVSQRELPRMALIQPSFRLGQLVLRAP